MKLALITFALAAGSLEDALVTTQGQVLSGQEMERRDSGILVQFENGEIFIPDEFVLEVFLDQEFEGTEQEGQAARARVISGLHHSEWRHRSKAESEYFSWEFTAPPQVLVGLQVQADRCYRALQEQWNLEATSPGKLSINVFRDPLQFDRVSGSGGNGHFRFQPPKELNLAFRGRDLNATERTLRRLVSFAAQSQLAEGVRLPAFPREGLADMHSTWRWSEDAESFAPSLHRAHWQRVLRDRTSAGVPPVSQIVASQDGQNRHWRWALVHWLSLDPNLSKGFDDFVQGLARDSKVKRYRPESSSHLTVSGSETVSFLAACLNIPDLNALDLGFAAFLESMEEQRDFREVALSFAEGLGEVERLEALHRRGSLTMEEALQYARLLEGEDRSHARSVLSRALERAPLDGEAWHVLGAVTDDEEEAARLRALARELGWQD